MSTNKVEQTSTNVSIHPQYSDMQLIWEQMRDTSAGEHKVKEKTTKYLPKTGAQLKDAIHGNLFYMAYTKRAIYYEYVKKTIQDSLGLLHKEPTVTELPESLEYMKNDLTPDLDNVNTYLRRIHEQQLITGRCGLLLDIKDDGNFTSILYSAERILNWDSQNALPEWIILDDSEYVIDTTDMSYAWKNKYILLGINSTGRYFVTKFEEWSSSYLSGDESVATYPVHKGNYLDNIPFTFCNASSVITDVELPPLLPLSNSTIAAYRGDADYRQAIHMQAAATLMFKGLSNDEISTAISKGVGPSSVIALPENDQDAAYLQVDGSGLSEMRESQENLKIDSKNQGIELLDKNSVESGAALSTRATIRTASLRTIAETAAMALEQQFRYALQWLGNESEEATVNANIDFIDDMVAIAEVVQMWNVVSNAGMTLVDYHAWLSERDLTSLGYDEWIKEIDDTGLVAFQ